MKKVIHKVRLDLGINQLALPKGSEILHIAEQGGQLCLWFKRPATSPEDTEHEIEVMEIEVHGTGPDQAEALRDRVLAALNPSPVSAGGVDQWVEEAKAVEGYIE